MDRETAHKLLDLVLSAKHDGVSIKFEPNCGRGYNCSIFIHEWEDDVIVSTKSYHLRQVQVPQLRGYSGSTQAGTRQARMRGYAV